MTKTFLGKRVAFITAHPDDESYLAGGTIYKNAQLDGQSFLLCATRGEKGVAHLRRPTSTRALAARRWRELQACAKVLRIAKLVCGTFPDGGLYTRRPALQRWLGKRLKILKPEAIVSFGPEGITGHLDHIAIAQAAQRLARELRVPYFAFTLPPVFHAEAGKALQARRFSSHYSSKDLRFAKPTLRVPISGAVKRRALRCHTSQLDNGKAFTGYPAYAVRAMLRAEYFVAH